MSKMMHQSAPWPHALEALVGQCAYRPGWKVRLADINRGQGCHGLTLVVTTCGYDSYHPDAGQDYRVNHFFIVPAAAYDERSWRHWLLEQLALVERHEAMEFFQVAGRPVFPPAHGPGNDPYLVLDYGSEQDRRTRFTGEVNRG